MHILKNLQRDLDLSAAHSQIATLEADLARSEEVSFSLQVCAVAY